MPPPAPPAAAARADGDGLRILQFLSRADVLQSVEVPELHYATRPPAEVPRRRSALALAIEVLRVAC